MHPRIIFVNGPPRAGKDTVGNIIFEELEKRGVGVAVGKFAGVLKTRTHAAYGLFDERGGPLPPDAFEDRKDDPLPEFLGLSPRKAYIMMSEAYYKPTHGQTVFGKLLLQDILKLFDALPCGAERPVIVISDSGFEPETEPIIERFGSEECALIRVHREGFDFSGDSRSYLDLRHRGVRLIDIDPCKDLIELRNATLFALRKLEFNMEGATP